MFVLDVHSWLNGYAIFSSERAQNHSGGCPADLEQLAKHALALAGRTRAYDRRIMSRQTETDSKERKGDGAHLTIPKPRVRN
jgi:hypothetical protein